MAAGKVEELISDFTYRSGFHRYLCLVGASSISILGEHMDRCHAERSSLTTVISPTHFRSPVLMESAGTYTIETIETSLDNLSFIGYRPFLPRLTQASMPAMPIPRAMAGASVLAHVIMSKDADHLSTTRNQLAIWDNEGGAPFSDQDAAEQTQAALAAEEENILRCLGAAVILH